MPKILNILKFAVPTLVVVLAVNFVLADWTAPVSNTPPAGNTPAPINVGASSQSKLGSLRLNTTIPSLEWGLEVYGISRFFGNLEIGNASFPSKVKIVDGTQGAGKILTSDANGLSSWQTLGTGSVPGVTSITAGTGIFVDPISGVGAVTISATGAPVACTWYTVADNVSEATYTANGGIGQCKGNTAGYDGTSGRESFGNITPVPYSTGLNGCAVVVANSQNAGALSVKISSFSYLGCTGIQ